MSDNQYETAEDEAYDRGIKLQQEWDSILGDIEEKWNLERGCTLDAFCLTFKGRLDV
jgi:hypothetical protein